MANTFWQEVFLRILDFELDMIRDRRKEWNDYLQDSPIGLAASRADDAVRFLPQVATEPNED